MSDNKWHHGLQLLMRTIKTKTRGHFKENWISEVLWEHVEHVFSTFSCPSGHDEAQVTLSNHFDKPGSQADTQAYSWCVFLIHSTEAPSIHPAGHSDSLCLPRCPNPSQLFYHSAPLPPRPPPLRAVLLSCTRMRCSDVPTSTPRLSLVLCVCLLKRLQGNSLPGAGSRCFLQLPAVWGGRQQDAVGEK